MNKEQNLPESVTYDMRLSDFYEKREGYGELLQSVDLEAVVHIYDFRMTLQEVYHYLTDDVLPERLEVYPGDLLDYALTANSLTYVQKALKGKDSVQYPLPESIAAVEEVKRILEE